MAEVQLVQRLPNNEFHEVSIKLPSNGEVEVIGYYIDFQKSNTPEATVRISIGSEAQQNSAAVLRQSSLQSICVTCTDWIRLLPKFDYTQRPQCRNSCEWYNMEQACLF